MLSAIRGRGELVEAHPASDGGEHAPNDRRRGRIFVKLSLRLVAPTVAIGWTTAGDQLATMNAGDASTHRALGELLSLDFGGERLGRTDELADGRFLEPLRHKLKPGTGMGNFVGKDCDVGLLAGQAIKRKGRATTSTSPCRTASRSWVSPGRSRHSAPVWTSRNTETTVSPSSSACVPATSLLRLKGVAVFLPGATDPHIDGASLRSYRRCRYPCETSSGASGA